MLAISYLQLLEVDNHHDALKVDVGQRGGLTTERPDIQIPTRPENLLLDFCSTCASTNLATMSTPPL